MGNQTLKVANDYCKSSLVAMAMCKTEEEETVEEDLNVRKGMVRIKMLTCRFCNDLGEV